MVIRNPNLAKLKAGYLFPEINRRMRTVLEKNKDAKIISLGIGDTTEPLTPHIIHGLKNAVDNLSTREGYCGYGDEQGLTELRQKIAEKLYGRIVSADEVFVSDGSKCDIGRLQTMFGADVSIAVQDPAYPVYVDGSVIKGSTGHYNEEEGNFHDITYMKCTKENNYFPELSILPKTDLIYFCSPNNPTGTVATGEQLRALIDFAKKNRSIIIFDSAYSRFITDDALPKSIFEIDGAREVALETSSFSKSVGFTGVRLGYTIVPKELKYEDGSPVINDWNRIMTTIFNGASNIVQQGGLSVLDKKGMVEMKQTICYYMENARIIKSLLDQLGIESVGGINSPYIWAGFKNKSSWDVFSEILEKAHVVTTPGSGFGPAGEGFIRFSAFGHREDVKEAVSRLKTFWQSS